jgi:hypothetical protein
VIFRKKLRGRAPYVLSQIRSTPPIEIFFIMMHQGKRTVPPIPNSKVLYLMANVAFRSFCEDITIGTNPIKEG